jgi:hypothetical protein
LTVEALAGADKQQPGDAYVVEDTGKGADWLAERIGVRPLAGGVIEVVLQPDREIEGPEARAAGAMVRSIAQGRRMPILLVISGVLGISLEARQVCATSIAASAFALVGESPVDRVIAHYLLRSKTEAVPAQFFTSGAEAAEWLRQYANE